MRMEPWLTHQLSGTPQHEQEHSDITRHVMGSGQPDRNPQPAQNPVVLVLGSGRHFDILANLRLTVGMFRLPGTSGFWRSFGQKSGCFSGFSRGFSHKIYPTIRYVWVLAHGRTFGYRVPKTRRQKSFFSGGLLVFSLSFLPSFLKDDHKKQDFWTRTYFRVCSGVWPGKSKHAGMFRVLA